MKDTELPKRISSGSKFYFLEIHSKFVEKRRKLVCDIFRIPWNYRHFRHFRTQSALFSTQSKTFIWKSAESSLNKLNNDWHVWQTEGFSENHFVFAASEVCMLVFYDSLKLAETDGWISAKSITMSTEFFPVLGLKSTIFKPKIQSVFSDSMNR